MVGSSVSLGVDKPRSALQIVSTVPAMAFGQRQAGFFLIRLTAEC